LTPKILIGAPGVADGPVSQYTPMPTRDAGLQGAILTLLDVQSAGPSLSGKLWPGPYTVALPSNPTVPATITPSSILLGSNSVGGVFQPYPTWSSVLINVAVVNNTTTSTTTTTNAPAGITLEFGRLNINLGLTTVLGTAVLHPLSSVICSGNNPFTWASTPGANWSLCDQITLTNKGQTNQLLVNVGGALDGTPSELKMTVKEAPYYYVLVTNLNGALRATVAITPQ
jgi:hypothetical protein